MLIKLLRTKNDAHDAASWADNYALYRGGKAFHARIKHFLPENSAEPADRYQKRKEDATYRPYVGTVVQYYIAWLFSAEFDVRKIDTATGDVMEAVEGDFYAQWKEEVAPNTTLEKFLRDRMTQTLIKGASHWLVEFPSNGGKKPQNKKEYDDRGLGNPTLRAVDREQVLDWECDPEDGSLIWVNIYNHQLVRPTILDARDTVIETWSIYDAENVSVFQIRYKLDNPPKEDVDVPLIAQYPHGCKQVPLVTLDLLDGLCPVEECKDAAKKEFKLSAAIDWNIKMTCYAMPLFNVDSKENPPQMGAGYFMMIGSNEKASWMAPPTEHLILTADRADSAREEIFRVSHQLALAVDNSKAAAVGRSGESKESDAKATTVVLNAYGKSLKDAIEETFEIMSDGRGDADIGFQIEGLDAFDTASVTTLLDNVAETQTLMIPSVTLHKETKKRAALAMVPNANTTVKDKICKEIEEGVDAQSEMELMQIEQPELNANKVPVLSGGKAKPAPPKPPPPGGKFGKKPFAK